MNKDRKYLGYIMLSVLALCVVLSLKDAHRYDGKPIVYTEAQLDAMEQANYQKSYDTCVAVQIPMLGDCAEFARNK